MLKVLLPVLALLLPAATAAAEEVCVLPVEYRLVGEDAAAPEKARMVEEQVVAGVEQAGHQPVRSDCSGSEPLVLGVAVSESGALYDIAVNLGERSSEDQLTGPFAGALQQVRRAVEALLAEVGESPEPPAAAVAPTEPEGPAAPPAAEPEGPTKPSGAGEESAAGPDVALDRTGVNPLWAGSLVLTAAGGAALIAGIVLLAVDDPCIDDTAEHGCRERFDSSAAGIPLAGLGSIAVGVGIAGLVLLERRPDESAAPADEGNPVEPAPPAKASASLSPIPSGVAGGVAVTF
jgi:hypothetical protein